MRAAGSSQVEIRDASVDATEGTNTPVAREYLIAQIAWIGSETPFLYTPVGAEGEPSRWHFQLTPTTQRAAIGAFFGTVALSANPPDMVLEVLNAALA